MGADPNNPAIESIDGNVTLVTPLYYAIEHGSTEVVRSLLASGARQDLDTGVIIIIAPLSTNVTPVTQDHFYSINAIKTMIYHDMSLFNAS